MYVVLFDGVDEVMVIGYIVVCSDGKVMLLNW